MESLKLLLRLEFVSGLSCPKINSIEQLVMKLTLRSYR